MANIKDTLIAHKPITILSLIGIAVILSVTVLFPKSKMRNLPPGFSRESPVLTKSVPPATLPAIAVPVSPKIIKEAKKRMAQDWGRDPFIFMSTQVTRDYMDIQVTAILISENSQWACVNGQIMKDGDRLGDYEIIAIDKYGIKVSSGENVREITLQP